MTIEKTTAEKIPTDIRKLIDHLAEAALMECRPPPVIKTDIYSAMAIKKALVNSLPGSDYRDFSPSEIDRAVGVIAMYNGVKIMRESASPQLVEFRRHFGALAEAFA